MAPVLRPPAATRGLRAPTAGLRTNTSRSRAPLAIRADAQQPDAEAQPQVENCVIIGSGPAGYTAAIYAARANLRPLVFEGFSSGVRGGQLMTTTEVENFPGFPEGITGPDLMDRMRDQAERWGAQLHTEDVESVDLSRRPFVVQGADQTVEASSIIIATGATARRLGIPSEHTFWSRGISACAICDGASPLFKNRPVAVVGGGDSAAEEAVYLTKYASKVHLLVRSSASKMRASKTMQDRARDHPQVEIHYETSVVDAYADAKGAFGGLLIEGPDGQSKLPVKGLFYGIGHSPNSALVEGQVELDEAGYVKVEGVATSVEGVFAAGDLQDTEWRQAVTAAGSGCMAAISVERYLTEHDLVQEFHQVVKEPVVKSKTSDAVPAGKKDFDPSASEHAGQYALRKLYHESDRVLAVIYTSPTCGPCRTLKPIFKKVLGEYEGQVHYIEIDIEADGDVAEAAGVMSTPTVQFFKDKERVAHIPGVKMKKEYRGVIDGALTSQAEKVTA